MLSNSGFSSVQSNLMSISQSHNHLNTSGPTLQRDRPIVHKKNDIPGRGLGGNPGGGASFSELFGGIGGGFNHNGGGLSNHNVQNILLNHNNISLTNLVDPSSIRDVISDISPSKTALRRDCSIETVDRYGSLLCRSGVHTPSNRSASGSKESRTVVSTIINSGSVVTGTLSGGQLTQLSGESGSRTTNVTTNYGESNFGAFITEPGSKFNQPAFHPGSLLGVEPVSKRTSSTSSKTHLSSLASTGLTGNSGNSGGSSSNFMMGQMSMNQMNQQNFNQNLNSMSPSPTHLQLPPVPLPVGNAQQAPLVTSLKPVGCWYVAKKKPKNDGGLLDPLWKPPKDDPLTGPQSPGNNYGSPGNFRNYSNMPNLSQQSFNYGGGKLGKRSLSNNQNNGSSPGNSNPGSNHGNGNISTNQNNVNSSSQQGPVNGSAAQAGLTKELLEQIEKMSPCNQRGREIGKILKKHGGPFTNKCESIKKVEGEWKSVRQCTPERVGGAV